MLYPIVTLVSSLLAGAAGDVASLAAQRDARKHAQAGAEKMREQAWDEAIVELSKAIELNPTMAAAHFDLGHCRMALKQYAQAEASYRASVQAIVAWNSLSEDARARRMMAIDDQVRALRKSMRRSNGGMVRQGFAGNGAEEAIRSLEASRPTEGRTIVVPAELSLALGGACLRQGKLAEAERAFSEALSVDSGLAAAHNNLAVVYMLMSRFEDARKEIDRAERSGLEVSPAFKRDLDEREKAAKNLATE